MSSSKVAPIFIISLPRSGSTLLQRMMMRVPKISSVSEPWILLPYVYSLKNKGKFAEYWHQRSVEAINDFISVIPGCMDTYYKELGDFALRLYSHASSEEAVYFLDKTPRYHLILEELFKIFPDGKFIFLWRNPLAVANSINTTWGNGKWKLYSYKIDLYEGLSNIVSSYKKHRDISYSIKYEDLVSNPSDVWESLMVYLELPCDTSVQHRFTEVELKGSMGDPTGVFEYDGLSSNSLNKWKKGFSNPLRKSWGRRYIKWIGEQRLSTMGYDESKLLHELSALPFGVKYIGSDIVRRIYGLYYCIFEPMIAGYKLKSLTNWKSVVSHR